MEDIATGTNSSDAVEDNVWRRRCTTLDSLDRRLKSLSAGLRDLVRRIGLAPHEERSTLRRAARSFWRSACRVAAVRRAWMGSRARTMGGHSRFHWPTDRDRVCVLDLPMSQPVSRRLARHCGETALAAGALGPLRHGIGGAARRRAQRSLVRAGGLGRRMTRRQVRPRHRVAHRRREPEAPRLRAF